MMLISFLLATIFGLTALVGLVMLFNGIRGLLTKRLFVPDLTQRATGAIRVMSGRQAFRWGGITALSSIALVAIAIVGFNLTHELRNGPAYLQQLIPPPDNYSLLYSYADESQMELAYGFQEEAGIIRQVFMKKLQDRGWKISLKSPIGIDARKGRERLNLAFIGWMGGEKGEYKSKAIITFTEVADGSF